MIIFVSLGLVVFVALFIRFAGRMVVYYELRDKAEILKLERDYQREVQRRVELTQEKIRLEEEAKKVFALYEVTKDIARSIDEENALGLLRTSLHHHISFRDCYYRDKEGGDEPLPGGKEVVRVIFKLKDEGQDARTLVIDGVALADKEKAEILCHQYELALRRVKLFEKLELIATTDSLTSVYTRRYMLERLNEEIQRSKARGTPVSFLMMDVDHFKKFNDRYGHLTGDQILREIARIIKENIREIDIAGRYGGEEFCVILPGTDPAGAQLAAERIRSAAEKASIKAFDTIVQATVSIGITTYPLNAQSTEDLVDKADWTLYKAKKQGRNRVCLYGQ